MCAFYHSKIIYQTGKISDTIMVKKNHSILGIVLRTIFIKCSPTYWCFLIAVNRDLIINVYSLKLRLLFTITMAARRDLNINDISRSVALQL
jgi:hypothetical protein